jgi:hypothetical protein
MSGRKPCLGYPSRTAAVLALRDQGLTKAAIAARIGIRPDTVSALECSARRWAGARAGNPDVCRSVLVPLGVLQRLAPAARTRGLRRETLAALIIEKVAEDALIDAVLDDGEEGGCRSGAETGKNPGWATVTRPSTSAADRQAATSPTDSQERASDA